MEKEDINKLFEDFNKYIDSLSHTDDMEYTSYIWNYPEAAIEEYGQEVYDLVTDKLMTNQIRKHELEQDFN